MRPRILCFAVLCLALGLLPVHASTIALNITSPVAVGATFDVVVQATNVFPSSTDLLFGYGFNVTHDSIFQYTGSTAGSFFDDFSGFPGSPTVVGFVTLNPPYFGALGQLDFSGPLTLATLHFVALGPGTGNIGVSGDPLNLDEGLIYLDPNTPNGAIMASANVTAAIPEGSSLILLVSGIPVLLWIGNRSRKL